MNGNFFYHFLDYFFIIFHTIFTLFNLFGWIFKQSRRLHLISMSVTAVSWFLFGIWYGWGYCILTDWHWEVRRILGQEIRSHSYVQFLIRRLTGLELETALVDTAVMYTFFVLMVLTIVVNLRKYLRRD